MARRRVALALSMAALAAALAAAAWVHNARTKHRTAHREEPDLPVLHSVPPFALIDSDNREFSGESLADSVWVIGFFSARCEESCVVMNANVSKAAAEFSGTSGLQFVSVSIDPDNDTPEILKAYAARFSADTRMWHFLTGPSETIHLLAAKGFKLGRLDDPAEHSSRLVLVDRTGHIRGYYDGIDPSQMQRLIKDIRSLLAARG